MNTNTLYVQPTGDNPNTVLPKSWPGNWVPMPCSDECHAWCIRWWEEPGDTDGFTSGVWADWLEDHPEHADGPLRELLVEWLRVRATEPTCNRIPSVA